MNSTIVLMTYSIPCLVLEKLDKAHATGLLVPCSAGQKELVSESCEPWLSHYDMANPPQLNH
jgi:hypothetical protein